jgi:DNA-binding PadR family transcriptional regulator
MLADMLILAALLSGPMHGYEIKKTYDQTLSGLVTLHHNQLYPALRRFETIGAVRCEAIEQQGKPDRHIYHLTDHGLSELRTMLRDFPHTIARNEMEFSVRFALFGFLEPEDRVKILQTRIQALQSLILEKGRYQKYLVSPIVGKIQPYVVKLHTFNDQRIHAELEWLTQMIEEVQ